MKIGISCTPVYNIKKIQKKMDGIGIYTANLCQALTQQNIQIKEIYFKNLWELSATGYSPQKNFYLAESPLYALSPGNFYQNLPTEADLIHITDYLVPRIKKTPIISTIHDAIMLAHPEWLRGPERFKRLKGSILKKLSERVDHVITCSRANIVDIVNFWKIPEYKISVIYHGLPEIWYQKIDPIIQKIILTKYKLNKPFFLMVGTIQPRKNIERIINAYQSLPENIAKEFNLVIVGKDHPTLTPPLLLEQIFKLEKSGHLVWLKYIPFDDLRCLYQNAQALIYPSLAEGFGFPILEGFASGIPVITAHSGATAEIAADAAYLIDPYSEEAIANAMLDLIEKPEVRNKLINQGLSRVKLFTWEKCAQETIQIYKKFI